jgi:hypothetical protein
MECLDLDSLGLGALSVAFHECPPKGALRCHEPILPRKDDTFPTVQLVLLSEEMLAATPPSPMSPPRPKEERAYTHQQVVINIT